MGWTEIPDNASLCSFGSHPGILKPSSVFLRDATGREHPKGRGERELWRFSRKRRIWVFFFPLASLKPEVGAFPVCWRSIQREGGALSNPGSGRADESLSWIFWDAPFPPLEASQGVGKQERSPRGWCKVKPGVHRNSWQLFRRFPPPWQRNFAPFPRDSRNLIPQLCQPESQIPPEISWHG